MCKLPAIIARFLAGATCLLVCSCFDVREEVWIGSDGSGRAELAYVVPGSAVKLAGGGKAVEGKIREAIAEQPKLRLDSIRVEAVGERVKIKVSISTDSVLALRDLDESEGMRSMPSAAVDLAGKFDVHLRGLDVDFSRTIRVKEALGLASFAIGAEDRRSRTLSYIIHLPRAASESNATSVEDAGKTLVWKSTLGEALRSPVVTRFKARMPIPRFLWLSAGLLVLAFTGLILRLRAIRRKAE